MARFGFELLEAQVAIVIDILLARATAAAESELSELATQLQRTEWSAGPACSFTLPLGLNEVPDEVDTRGFAPRPVAFRER
jgi:hypothetical protein